MKGPPGEIGDAISGNSGVQGDQGDPGNAGRPGDQGISGPKGFPGEGPDGQRVGKVLYEMLVLYVFPLF